MSAIATAIEQVKDRSRDILEKIRQKLFGANNENLDFFIDSFNKFDARQKIVAVCCILLLTVLVFFSIFYLYFTGVRDLKLELSDGLAALRELQVDINNYETETAKMTVVSNTLNATIGGFSVRPFFESLAQKLAVKVELSEPKQEPFPATDPLSEKGFQKLNIDMRFVKISIPRLLEFIKETEKSAKFLKIQDLNIREIYEREPSKKRLYFTVNMTVRGYVKG